MNAATTRPSQYTQPEQVLYVAFELSSRTWKLGMSVGFGQKARERNVSAAEHVPDPMQALPRRGLVGEMTRANRSC